jgi:uncharacterized surface protein with fasciclin (FAS1) repeats
MRVTLLAASVAVLVALVPGGAPASDVASIYDTLPTTRQHTVMLLAVKDAGQVATLRGRDGVKDQYTFFAPSDAAFKELDDETIKRLATDPAAVKRFVLAHVVRGKVTLDDLKRPDVVLRPLQGGLLKVDVANGVVRVGGAKIVSGNIQCRNGVIHVTDAALPVARE